MSRYAKVRYSNADIGKIDDHLGHFARMIHFGLEIGDLASDADGKTGTIMITSPDGSAEVGVALRKSGKPGLIDSILFRDDSGVRTIRMTDVETPWKDLRATLNQTVKAASETKLDHHLASQMMMAAFGDRPFKAVGGTNYDSEIGGPADDILSGGAGDDFIIVTPGRDVLDGGANDETGDQADFGALDGILGLEGGDRGVFADIRNGVIRLPDGTKQTMTGIEELAGTAADDTLRGDAGANYLDGGRDGEDRLVGRLGDDTMKAEAGDVTMLGGAGKDELSGGFDADSLLGNAGADVIRGGDGGDVLDGGVGRDTLDGGEGADTLIGGAGADEFVFRPDDGADVVMDFDPLVDTFLLDGGLAFADLSFTEDGDDVVVSAAGESLFTVLDASVGEIDQGNLFFVVG